MRQITKELFTSATQALYPTPATDAATEAGPARDTEGSLNSMAYSQVLSLFLWFGFDISEIYKSVLASAQSQLPELGHIHLPVMPFNAELIAIENYIQLVPIGTAVEMVSTFREKLEIMAGVVDDSAQLGHRRLMPRYLAALRGLDEQINKRIEGEGEAE